MAAIPTRTQSDTATNRHAAPAVPGRIVGGTASTSRGTTQRVNRREDSLRRAGASG